MRSSIAPVLLTLLSLFCLPLAALHADENRPANSPRIRIVKDELVEVGNFYAVKGTVYNPNDRAVKNVTIKYYVWKKWQGQEGHGFVIRATGGLVQAVIKFIPPKQSVDFATAPSDNAPVMTVKSGLKPDPLEAVISAEWDE